MFTVKKWELNYEYIRCLKRYPGNINGFEELLRIYYQKFSKNFQIFCTFGRKELTTASVFKTKKAPQKISAPASASKDPAPAPGYVRRC